MDEKSEVNDLVEACFSGRPFAWQRVVDEFMPVVLHTVQEIDVQMSQGWKEEQHHEFVRKVFEELRDNDFALLRRWQSDSDFNTFLVIATRRIVLGNEKPSVTSIQIDTKPNSSE